MAADELLDAGDHHGEHDVRRLLLRAERQVFGKWKLLHLGFDNAPLRALATGEDGGNGVFLYASGGGFPTNTFNAANYWVDVVFTPASANRAPVAVNDSYSTNQGATLTVASLGLLSNDTDADGNALTAIKVTNPANGTVTVNANGGFTYTPTAGFSGADTFTYKANDGLVDSNTATVTITVNTAANHAPVAVNDSYAVNQGQTLTVATPGVLANDTDADSNILTAVKLTNPANGTVTLNANGSFTYTPNAAFTGTDSFTYAANDGAVASNTATVTIAVSACPCTIWSPQTTPAILNENDTQSIELGVKFRSSQNGTITALRFYKGPTNTGVHVGKLWSSSGTLLASVTFTGETASGWQQMNFSTPVTITANTTYVASYYAPNGRYSANANYFTSGVDNAPLRALATGEDGGNGVFLYASGGGFPTNTFNAANYWVDVVFTPAGANRAPVAVNDSYSTNQGATLTVASLGLLSNDTDQDGNALTASLVTNTANGTVTLNANGSFTYTPNAAFLGTDSFTYTASDGVVASNTATVTIAVTAPTSLSTMSVGPTAVVGGANSIGTVTLTGPAPAGGAVVTVKRQYYRS